MGAGAYTKRLEAIFSATNDTGLRTARLVTVGGGGTVVELHLLLERLVEPFAHDLEHRGVVVEDAIGALGKKIEVEETMSRASIEEFLGLGGIIPEEAGEVDGLELSEDDGGFFEESRHFDRGS